MNNKFCRFFASLIFPKFFKDLAFRFWSSKKNRYKLALVLDIACITLILLNGIKPAQRIVSPIINNLSPLTSLKETRGSVYEVMGFAPHWTFNNLDNVDFGVLTTLAYFDVEILADGNLDKESSGHRTFMSKKATDTFKKAHANGTRVVLTVTQMDNQNILALMDSEEAQVLAISQMVDMVADRGIDGINIDLEYSGNPGKEYRDKFNNFVKNITEKMHERVPGSKVTVSVYASAVKDPKIYDIAELGDITDGIFMMAYDFAVAGSDHAMPTSPLYGHKDGKYWYDIATAVDDFLKQMSADKLILGVPYYGYNWLIYDEPKIKAETRPTYSWRGKPRAQTYTLVQEDVNLEMEGITDFKEGWDDFGKVSWKAYFVEETDTWRMVFADDAKSLGIKYDFAKDKNLKGVGMWALGFDKGKSELWSLLREKFGMKEFADKSVMQRDIKEGELE